VAADLRAQITDTVDSSGLHPVVAAVAGVPSALGRELHERSALLSC
jgi:hypothetical protein